MGKFNFKIADEVLCYEITRRVVLDQLSEYRTFYDDADIFISPTDEEKTKVRNKFINDEILFNKQRRHHPPADVEFHTLHYLTAREFVKRGILLVHGSAVVADGKAYLFIAPSGTGKSTHTRLWLEALGDRAYIINDDKQMIRITDNGAVVYSTPWGIIKKPEKSEKAPLAAVISLERGDENKITPALQEELFLPLFKASLRGETVEDTARIAALQQKLLGSARLYTMKCTPTIDAAKTAINELVK